MFALATLISPLSPALDGGRPVAHVANAVLRASAVEGPEAHPAGPPGRDALPAGGDGAKHAPAGAALNSALTLPDDGGDSRAGTGTARPVAPAASPELRLLMGPVGYVSSTPGADVGVLTIDTRYRWVAEANDWTGCCGSDCWHASPEEALDHFWGRA